MSCHKIRFVGLLGVVASAALAACSDSGGGTDGVTGTPPVTVAEAVIPHDVSVTVGSPANAMLARVAFNAAGADSARVVYQALNGPVQSTPYRAASQASDTMLVLGLRPNMQYSYFVEARTGASSEVSASSAFTTGALPGQLSIFQLQSISGAQHHYAATSVKSSDGSYAVIFDSTGTIVWYHDFTSTGMDVSNVVMQPNGDITAFVGNTSGWQPLPGYYVEMSPAGDVVQTYNPPPGTFMDDHELLITGSGATKKAHYFTFTTRTEDLTSLGMGSALETAGHQIQRQNAASGALEFTWDAWNHITFDEWVGDSLAKATRPANTDFDHPNALTFDNAGNYVVSWRNLDQIMAIDPASGAVLWRLGGKKSDFTFVNDPLGGFHKQHAVKILANGDVLLFDNGTEHSPAQSRAAEYKLDFAAKTATLVWESRHDPIIFAQFVGWVERLTSGDTWVSYSFAGRTVEVDASSNVVWESQLAANGAPQGAYRIVPITSLYAYRKP